MASAWMVSQPFGNCLGNGAGENLIPEPREGSCENGRKDRNGREKEILREREKEGNEASGVWQENISPQHVREKVCQEQHILRFPPRGRDLDRSCTVTL